MKILLAKNVSSRAPGPTIGKDILYDFKVGEMVEIVNIDYPGKPTPEESIARLLGQPVFDSWTFWTDFDPDISAVFEAEHIATLILSEYESNKLAEAPFDSAPFTLVIEE